MADVDPKLQSNRVKDLGGTVRPSRKIELAIIVAVSLILTTFALVCSHAGHPFQIFALMYLVSGQWSLTAGQWALAVAVLVVLAVACGVGAWLIASKAVPWATGAKARTRVDVYAPAMGHGEAVEKVTRQRAEAMASRLIEADHWRKGMSPGYPLGLNIVDNTSMYTSWEDMAIVLAGPRSGKSLCYAIPAVLSAPGPCLATSNKGDILDVTAPIRRLDHPNGEIWTFDPERIADPNRKSAPWVWDLIASVQSIADAKRIADCWRYASGQPQTGGDDFFPGTAAQQLADYLFAAHLGGRSVSDVFRWCSNERDTSPADILSEYPRYAGIASRVSSVIALTPETRSGVFGSLQTMVAFLADPEIIDWIDPHRDTNGNIDERRGLFDPYEFATSEDTLYLLSAQGRPSTALTASLTAVVAFTAFQRAQSEFTGNNRRLPVPLCCVLDEAANICRWPELADVYSYFGSAGIPIMTIWQNLATIPGTLYKIRLKHASLCKDNVDQMQVVINGTPIEMTRVTANGKAGDKVGEKSTTIGTRVTNENRWHHSDQWETYEGYYVIPDGQTTTRFGFKAVNYLDPTKGNLLDDVTFARAYKLSYDKNASDATGSVPSNQRGKENTVQPAEARGTGTVKTVADGDSSKSLTVNPGFDVPDYSKLNDGGLHWMYVNPAEGKAWSYYDYINPAQPVQQVAGMSLLHAGRGGHRVTADDLMELLAVAAPLYGVHHDVLGCHERQLVHNVRLDDLRVNHKAVRNVHYKVQDRVGRKESFRHADALVRGVVQRALKPLRRSGNRRVQRVYDNVACKGGDTLAAHRVALIRHGRGTDLVLLKRLFHFLQVLQKTDVVGEFCCACRNACQNV